MKIKKTTIKAIRKRQLMMYLFAAMSCFAFAYDFQADGFYFVIVNGTSEAYIYPGHAGVASSYKGDITIPETVSDERGNAYTVVGIGENAFAASQITSISLPNTIRFINDYAFTQCKSLKSLDLPNKLESIGKAVISGSGITHIKIPHSVTTIAKSAFGPDANSSGCQLESVDLSELSSSITELPERIFWGCNIKTIIIPNTIAIIGKEAFMSCEKLESVILSSSTTSIKKQAFYGCTSITKLVIPNSVSSIEDYAFYSCKSLKEVISEINNPFSISENVFRLISSNATLKIPKGTKNTYLQFPGWTKNFTSIIQEGYQLTLKSTGNGTLSYNGDNIRGASKTYTVEEGTNVAVSISPDNGYQIKSIKVNNSTVSASSSYSTTINADTKIEVEFEAIPPKTYTLTVSASGNGFASYGGESIRSGSKSFTINEGTSAKVSFSPDSGYRIKRVKVNGSSVDAGSSYTVTVNSDTKIEVEFEAIPVTKYTLTIKATGNGSASYSGESIRGTTKTYSVNEGSSVKVSFSPDTGYRIKSLKVNNTSVTANSSYSTTMNSDTKVEVEFEAIPVTTYTLTITASGSGSASYSNETIRGDSKSFTVNEGTSAKISFNPDNGYRVKSVKVNNSSVDAGSSYTVTVNSNTTVAVEFEAIPATTYTLTITASGNGSVSYNNESIRGGSKSYTVNEGTKASLSFNPDNGYRVKNVKVNNTNVDAGSSYTVTVNSNTKVEVEFEAIPITTYTLTITASGNGSVSYGNETIREGSKTFTVNAGSTANISFSPDNGYRVRMVTDNGTSVDFTSSGYTTTVNSDTKVKIQFEAIPATTYTMTIKASGNGSVSYSNQTIRGGSKSFTVNEGTRASISFSPDSGYRVKSVKVNNSKVDAGSSYTVTVNSNTTVEVEFEAIPITTYTLTISATGNGSATYGNETIRGGSRSYTLNEGTSVKISFSPDSGYRIKSVKANGSNVGTSSSYSTTVNSNTKVEVEFEAIPDEPTPTPTTYTLSIKSTGNGSASYGGETIRNTTKSYSVNAGTNVSVSFSPDNGYRIKSVKVNGSNVSANSSYNTTVNSNTTIEVEFEAIPVDPTPTPTTYTLSIKATGNGSASYAGESIRNSTKSYTVNAGGNVSVNFNPDNGYRIKSLKVNSTSVAASSSYSATINANTSIEVEFEAIPATTYTLTITASGSGTVSYNGSSVKGTSKNFSVDDGTSVTISFSASEGNILKSIKVNGNNVTSSVRNDKYTLIITANTTVEVVFEKSDSFIAVGNLNYKIESFSNHTVKLDEGDYGITLEIPDKITYQNQSWAVIGVAENALDSNEELAAIIWNPEVTFDGKVSNPNLLLYVKDEKYAPSSIKNVVANNVARSITLYDAQSGNNFFCPRAFTAQSIAYTHSYSMKTGEKESRGWETIALPFDVQKYIHFTKGEIMPFAKWTMNSNMKPFWLCKLTANGFVEADGILANTPYIISMPNNDIYQSDYQLSGSVTFSAQNVEVKKSESVQTAQYGDRTFIPNFLCQNSNAGYLALNVNNDYEYYQGGENEGSKFILNLRRLHPFEAYMTTISGTRSIDVFDGMTTAIRGIQEIEDRDQTIKVYNLNGQCIKKGTSIEEVKQGLPAGLYIINNKKIIIK